MSTSPTAVAIVASDVSQRIAASTGQHHHDPIQVLNASLPDALKAYAAEPNTKRRTAIYSKEIAPVLRNKDVTLGPILAANSLGTIAGDLVVQRALTLLKLSFPALSAISTDFSDENVKFGQEVVSRIRTIPEVANYVPGTGYATQNAVTTDVSVTINNHKGVPIIFNANELASTSRDLFGEQAEGAHYALGKVLMDAVYALITPTNFENETVSAAADFNRSKVSSMATALFMRGVPGMGRFLILSPTYFDKLGNDAAIVSYAAFQRPEIITEYMLPRVSGFQPYAGYTLPTDDNLVGFAGTPDSLVVATRVPGDYTSGVGVSNNGSVSVVTNPDTGISVQLVKYVEHAKAESAWRVALMFGVAKGQTNSGQRLVSEATGS